MARDPHLPFARGRRPSAALLAGLLGLVTAAALPARVAAQSFPVTGRFEYLDRQWGWNGWTGLLAPRPIRHADVYVLDSGSGAILGTTSTGPDGEFALQLQAVAPVDLVVRCDADSDLDGSFQRVRVTTEGNAEYSVSSPAFPGHDPLLPLDIGTVTAQAAFAGSAQANPFNLFDQAVSVAEYVTGPLIGAAPTAATWRVYWPGGGGSYANGNQAHIADDDGDDDAVILHELGHVIHNQYSQSDNTGGTHYFGDSDQDPRLSFGEGFATFFAGAVLDQLGLEAIYQDANGSATVNGSQLRLRLETASPYAADAYGAADEVAVAVALFDLLDTRDSPDETPGVDDDGFGLGTTVAGQSPQKAWWAVFTGPVKLAPDLTLNDAWDGWLLLNAADPHFPELQAIFDNRHVRFWNDDAEPNGTSAASTPMAAVSGAQWLTGRSLYWSPGPPFAPGSGDEDWFATPLVKGDVVLWRTRYPDNAGDADTQCDPYIELYDPTGKLVESADDGGTGRNAMIDDFQVTQTGTWRLRVRTLSSLRRYGSYDVRCKYVDQNFPPQIVSGPAITPDPVVAGQTALLEATASDADPGSVLSFHWSAPAGGQVLGEGPTVSFLAPVVSVPTPMSVKLVVVDELGAESLPAEVAFSVVPQVGGTCAGPAGVVPGGVGKPGLLGIPLLEARNLPVVPSTDFALSVTGAYPLKVGNLVFGFGLLAASFDQGKLYPTPNLLVPAFSDSSGTVLLPLGLPADPILCGLTLYVQYVLPGDPGAAGAKHTAQSRYLAVTFGD